MAEVVPRTWRSRLPLLVAGLAFAVFAVLLLAWSRQSDEVQAFELRNVHRKASAPLAEIDRVPGQPKFLFANGLRDDFSFEARLRGVRDGPRSLWLHASHAPDHGRVTIEHKGRVVGSFAGAGSFSGSLPQVGLARVGTLEVSGPQLLLQVRVASPRAGQPFYSELGLVVLAPPDITREALERALAGDGKPQVTPFDLLLAALASAFAGLYWLSRRPPVPGGRRAFALAGFALCLGVPVLVAFATFLWTATPHPFGPQAARAPLASTALNAGAGAALAGLDSLQQQVLPDRSRHEAAASGPRESRGQLASEVYGAPLATPARPVWQSLFGGAFARWQSLAPARFHQWLALLLGGVLLAAAAQRLRPSRAWVSVGLGAAGAASVLASVRAAQGWDEFFINLRHARLLLEQGVYSVNARQLVEGSVDLLPLLATALLGWLGVDLASAFVAVSLAGNLLVVFLAYLIVSRATGSAPWALVAAAVAGLYPNVIWVGGTGFTAVLFTGWLLAGIHCYLLAGRRTAGLLLLATLTLVRTEGVLFALAVVAYGQAVDFVRARGLPGRWAACWRRALPEVAWVLGPYLASMAVRWLVYGQAIPNPIVFKNSGFDVHYVSVGLARLREMLAVHDVPLLAVLAAVLLAVVALHRGRGAPQGQDRVLWVLAGACAVVFGAILPYYVGGGDWFPVYWNRYGLPFNLLLAITLLAALHRAFAGLFQGWRLAAALAVFAVTLGIGYQQATRDRADHFVRRALDEMAPSDLRWQRVDRLASAGLLLRDLLPADAVVASPEEATVMYFADREMLGLMGVSTPDVARMPLQPIHTGDILHRKRALDAVHAHRPDVIALYEPVHAFHPAAGQAPLDAAGATLRQEVFTPLAVNVAYYRVGSFDALAAQGYRHVTLLTQGRLYSFLVRDRVRGHFELRLRALGFGRLGQVSVPYAVDDEITRRFRPGPAESSDRMTKR